MAANVQGDPEKMAANELCLPFESHCDLPLDAPFFLEHYGRRGDSHPNWWRQIDFDWMAAAQGMAAQLSSHRNNASLALAIEVGDRGVGPVLLFPADAEAASWLAWTQLHWSLDDRRLDIRDLLRRTIIYQVGQHGDERSTRKRDENQDEYGLNLMRDGVIGLLCVDEALSGQLGRQLPHHGLHRALMRKSRGNVLRSDDLEVGAPPLRVQFSAVPLLPAARWRRSREKRSDGSSLFYEIELS